MRNTTNDLSISKLDCFSSDKGTVMHAKKNSNDLQALERHTFQQLILTISKGGKNINK